MELINNTIKLIETSFSFDHHIGTKNTKLAFNELNEMHNILKSINPENPLFPHLDRLCVLNQELLSEFNLLDVSDNVLSTLQTMHKSRFSKDKKTIVLFYSPTCIHSKKFLPTWNRIVDTMSVSYNLILINIKNRDYTTICLFFNINEYPTIVMVNGEKYGTYCGEYVYESIKSFAKHY